MTPKEQQLINFAHYLNTHPLMGVLFGVLAVWTIVWKGVALWKAARNNQTAWYIILLAVNTLGILEIVYIFFFSKRHQLEQVK
jgi:methionyl-tRNA synthetase